MIISKNAIKRAILGGEILFKAGETDESRSERSVDVRKPNGAGGREGGDER